MIAHDLASALSHVEREDLEGARTALTSGYRRRRTKIQRQRHELARAKHVAEIVARADDVPPDDNQPGAALSVGASPQRSMCARRSVRLPRVEGVVDELDAL